MLPPILNSLYQGIRFVLGLLSDEDLKEIFRSRNSPQSELEFLRDCFQHPSDMQTEIALAVRFSIARLGQIESEFIRSELSFEDLDLLPYWRTCGDAGFDSAVFGRSIQSELGSRVTEKELSLANVRDPDLHVEMKIREFIEEFYDWYSSLP